MCISGRPCFAWHPLSRTLIYRTMSIAKATRVRGPAMKERSDANRATVTCDETVNRRAIKVTTVAAVETHQCRGIGLDGEQGRAEWINGYATSRTRSNGNRMVHLRCEQPIPTQTWFELPNPIKSTVYETHLHRYERDELLGNTRRFPCLRVSSIDKGIASFFFSPNTKLPTRTERNK